MAIDGVERPDLPLDTDPLIVGIGANLNDGTVITAAIPRAMLLLPQIAFVSSAPQLR